MYVIMKSKKGVFMKKGLGILKLIACVAVAVIAAVYYYIQLPAINIHSYYNIYYDYSNHGSVDYEPR